MRVLQFIRRLLCRHPANELELVRKLYGDEIITAGHKRYVCDCRRCGAQVLS